MQGPQGLFCHLLCCLALVKQHNTLVLATLHRPQPVEFLEFFSAFFQAPGRPVKGKAKLREWPSSPAFAFPFTSLEAWL